MENQKCCATGLKAKWVVRTEKEEKYFNSARSLCTWLASAGIDMSPGTLGVISSDTGKGKVVSAKRLKKLTDGGIKHLECINRHVIIQ